MGSNTSLENPVLFLGAHSAPWLSSHTSAVSTGHKRLVCAQLQYVQTLGSMPASVPKRSDSFTPTITKTTRLTVEKAHLSWYFLPCSLYHCIITAPKGASVPVCGYYQVFELQEDVVNMLRPCWHSVPCLYYFPWERDTIDSQCYKSVLSLK